MRGLDFKYSYKVRGTVYENLGSTYSEKISLDDTLKIIYIPDNPKISRADFELE